MEAMQLVALEPYMARGIAGVKLPCQCSLKSASLWKIGRDFESTPNTWRRSVITIVKA